jgi:hypothetical protein
MNLRALSIGSCIAACLLFLPPVRAADIEVIRVSNGSVVRVSGAFKAGDDKKFATALLSANGAIVSLDSPGGSLQVGLEIGRALRLQGSTVVVEDGRICASACGLAWLGGTRRLVGAKARVGFHAAYFVNDDGKAIEVGYGNALVGAYLSKIGMSDPAILYITKAAPADMQWLNIQDANTLGIHVTLLGAPVAPRKEQPEEQRKPAQLPTCRVADVRPPDAWLALRSEPSDRAGRQLRRLVPGDSFAMLGEQRNDWYHVRAPDGLTGWVSWGKPRWIAC